MHLITVLAGKTQETHRAEARHRQWKQICGAAPYPFTGKNAKVGVSRTRQECDKAGNCSALEPKAGSEGRPQ